MARKENSPILDVAQKTEKQLQRIQVMDSIVSSSHVILNVLVYSAVFFLLYYLGLLLNIAVFFTLAAMIFAVLCFSALAILVKSIIQIKLLKSLDVKENNTNTQEYTQKTTYRKSRTTKANTELANTTDHDPFARDL